MNYPQAGDGWQQMPPPIFSAQPQPGQPYAPRHYPSATPPRKKKTWLWVLLAIVAVIVLAVGGGVAFFAVKSPAQDGMTLTLKVTGTGSAGVWYTPDLSVKRVDLPWTEEITIPKSESFELDVAPVNHDAPVTCTVSIGGTDIVTNTSSPTGSGSAILICKAELGNH
ncbi:MULTISPECIES: hypothetical protein [unclassified Mycolicibacterium]|uniref:hypothetical protein n=2 Tax=Mycolicibacterium TaxID=1866885 RepID=UPI0012DED42E|nr:MULTISPECIES: hypothetical protein [unclassified Mycolicibacterium]MUL83566.1 hypothetical protein [Mycolicibacterium sp. CBMA 329]MUL90557.1 hypothetical protein [Mycolicibacterium sp. CBMA 331]MUM25419.1 hypothetical protein [Mycolicibacterium sp. CBMA 295]MUM41501.1 hypothetical protein [Mycolicibacterium sp. CBMA 247]MUM45965.1 hypothetical protein [Mycolicibacterium sp. CBMA 294]